MKTAKVITGVIHKEVRMVTLWWAEVDSNLRPPRFWGKKPYFRAILGGFS